MYIYCLPELLPWDETDSKLLKFVSLQRLKRIQSYYLESDRKLSLYAALLVRQCLSTISGLSALNLVFGCDKNHKPTCLTKTSLHFNLSHTQGFILCGISTHHPVGIDVERITSAPFSIMRRFFHPMEIQYVEDAPFSEQDNRFYEIWTKKEAYTKQQGTGLVPNLSELNILSSDIHPLLHTWKYNNYVCSICNNSNSPNKITYIQESEIRKYFLHMSL
ncbi:4'-phosphopantetheinyl transferase family protein [Lacrimispora algidixylanolytica]|uniref:Uncharacterized protein n=1 Tax=Lacrimispora algidixylanolytica TaxID=94868 RepID=A0A419SYE1_9FIRM|nr:4'-phosphopantetheinyl transferase superfamily protein [Lacrimispora algidixylanolytica]RKD30254.1 hypothetical protein BET01_06575 [Lacrimispora algidixylanolytica]